MKIAITGAGGLIGSHLVQHLARQHDVLALKRGDLDITDRGAVERCMLDARPSLVINCVGIEVDDCERDLPLARAINVDGPGALAEAANDAGAELIHFSTNYVFDGTEIGRAPYTIQDEPRPINIYGKTKLAGEGAVLQACPRTYLIRTSWVYGRGKNNFLSTAHPNLVAGKRIRAVIDLWASTTYVVDLVARIAEILSGRRYGIYHVVNDGVCSYYEFALDAGRLAGLNTARIEELVEAIKEEEAKRLAPRPRYTPMRCLISEELGLSPMRDWRSALADYVGNEKERNNYR